MQNKINSKTKDLKACHESAQRLLPFTTALCTILSASLLPCSKMGSAIRSKGSSSSIALGTSKLG